MRCYDDPPYATLSRDGVRLSLAEQGHPAPDRPGITLAVPGDPSALPVVAGARGRGRARRCMPSWSPRACPMLAEPWAPPWGGLRFFVVDPDGYLVEIEQPG